MAKPGKKKKRARSRKAATEKVRWLDEDGRRRALWFSAKVLAFALILGGIAVGLTRLERYVHAQTYFSTAPEIVLIDPPAAIGEIVHAQLEPLTRGPWIDRDLCPRIADRLGRIAWVRRVERVRRSASGRIEVHCDYRLPVALVQDGGEFVLVDDEQIRLPGRYPYCESWPLIQGVATAPPPAGQRWNAPDLAAGLRVAERVALEPFADQVSAVLVHNYNGRLDAREGHLELATDRAGGRIIWGSAPGEEVEENSAAQKLAILRRNHELYGRIDAGRRVIDISTFPDRFTTPLDGALGGGRIVEEHPAA
ncbi:MAG: hypothetical protein IID40_10710 [Planctomycetes bacterium]|nr:hypothetical protein [Planctomycetota bacterium]